MRRVRCMRNGGRQGSQGRRRERERRRRNTQAESTPTPLVELGDVAADGPVRRAAATDCGWCGAPITPGRRGPTPKWCSAACRHRAWEQTRAAASGRSAVLIVERRIEIPTQLPLTRRNWLKVLGELTAQLDDDRVYDRDLPNLAIAIDAVVQAYLRRACAHAMAGDRRP
jgi:hypothetical protein